MSSSAKSTVLLVLLLAGCTEPQFRQVDASGTRDATTDAQGAYESRDGSEDVTRADGAPPAAEDGATPAPPTCTGDREQTPGHDCAGVVHCINVGACELSTHKCCMDFLGFDNTCTSAATCGTLMRSACDGPEDCGAGEACCLEGLLSLCLPEAQCAEPTRVCHTDSDCHVGRCVQGSPYGGVLIAREWGFCRG